MPPRRFQFRLRTLMIGVALLAAILGGLRFHRMRLDDDFRRMNRRDPNDEKRSMHDMDAEWKAPPLQQENLTAALAISFACAFDPQAVFVTGTATACTHLAHEHWIVVERRAWFSAHSLEGVEIEIDDARSFRKFAKGDPAQAPSWIRTQLGDFQFWHVYVRESIPTSEKQAAAVLFREADILELPRGYPGY
jgi:hypothetical protein